MTVVDHPAELDRPRLGVVLSAGGLRGAAHLGVLRRLVRAGVPIDVIVGTSAGAVVGAYFAAVGLSIDELIADAPRFRGRHLLFHGMARRAPAAISHLLHPLCGIIPARLRQLDQATFGRLHHGISAFGVVCHDLVTRRPWYFSTAEDYGLPLADAVKASAAVPGVFPPREVVARGQHLQLVDGGLSDGMPCDFARSPGLGATHLIVSDCRANAGPVGADGRTIYIRPALGGMRPLIGGDLSVPQAVLAGEEAITDNLIARALAWTTQSEYDLAAHG